MRTIFKISNLFPITRCIYALLAYPNAETSSKFDRLSRWCRNRFANSKLMNGKYYALLQRRARRFLARATRGLSKSVFDDARFNAKEVVQLVTEALLSRYYRWNAAGDELTALNIVDVVIFAKSHGLESLETIIEIGRWIKELGVSEEVLLRCADRREGWRIS